MNSTKKFMAALPCDTDTLYNLFAGATEEYAWICDPQAGLIRYSPKMLEEFNLPSEIVKDPLTYWEDLVHKDDWQKFYDSNMHSFNGELIHHIVEFRAKNRKNEWIWLQCRGTMLLNQDGKPHLFGGYISNMGRRNKIDFQTGLFNKYEFRRQIEKWLTEKKYQTFGVMILGVDDFKNIVQMRDREFGDEVLREIAQKLQSVASCDTEVYRLDGDEFGLLFKETSRQTMLEFYQRVQNQFRKQQEFRGGKYFCTLSGGGCLMPDDGESYSELSHGAEASMHYAKRRKKNSFCFYSPDILAANDLFSSLMENLRESIENNFAGFFLVYQPQVDAKTGVLKGLEALLRWNCEKFPSIGPMKFIPVLEESGMILPLGRWIIEEAVKTCCEWNRYDPNLTMSINLSNHQIFSHIDSEEDIFSYISHVLHKEGVNKQNIILELTESSVVSNIQYLTEKMKEIRAHGVRIAIDDFGTGYSSLGILKKMPADFVKLDKIFLDEIETSHNDFDSTFIRLVTNLCHSVGISVVQEGVETESQCCLIRNLGPDYIQGYYFSKPRTKQEIYDHYICQLNSIPT